MTLAFQRGKLRVDILRRRRHAVNPQFATLQFRDAAGDEAGGELPDGRQETGVPVLSRTFEELVTAARELVPDQGRRVLGITGAPGSGKSTIAARLVEALGPAAVSLPMDGFHLANVELRRLGRQDRKGAPDTFDAAGYTALLRRVRDREELVYAPGFDRSLEEPVAGAIPIAGDVPLVVTEGNYLLLTTGRWADVRPLLDVVWYLEPDEAMRLERLVTRHIVFGKPAAAAWAWAHGSDAANAAVIAADRDRADVVIDPPTVEPLPVEPSPADQGGQL
jgi:pantothenate kinase